SRERDAASGWGGRILAPEVSPGLRRALAEHLEARLFAHASASQLDAYAICPFRYFVQRVLGLEPLADPLEPDFTLTGLVVHTALCDFYRTLSLDGNELGASLLAGPAAFLEAGSDRAAEVAWALSAREPMRAALERALVRLQPARSDAFSAELARQLGSGL